MTAPIWISTDYVPEKQRSYLTPGKRYQVDKISDNGGLFVNDRGHARFTRLKSSEWLAGRDWTVHTSPEEQATAPEMQVWHDEPCPQPSLAPGERLLFFTLGILASVFAFVVSAGLTWMVMR